MMDNTAKKEKIIEILHNQVAPALGCTEPGAVALAVARAKELLGVPVEKLSVAVDKNVLKNGAGVGIPGTKERGNAFAAALSLVIGKSEYGLEVLKDVDVVSIEAAKKLLAAGVVETSLNAAAHGLDITAKVSGGGHTAVARIQKTHMNFAYEEKDGKVLVNTLEDAPAPGAKPAEHKVSLQQQIKEYTIVELAHLAHTLPAKELAFMQDGIDMNMTMADYGLKEGVGVGAGRFLYNRDHATVAGRAKAYTAAASEARMAGAPLPVMSSAGSGNHGLTAILPIAIYGKELGKSDEEIWRAVAFSHMVCIYVKAYLGALSPICGCGVAAGVGCTAGLTFLRGGNDAQIAASITNMISGIAGMLCDGAKLSCAVKLSDAVTAAIDASDMALAGIFIPSDAGIMGAEPERTIQNMARVSVEGMDKADNVMVDVMSKRCS